MATYKALDSSVPELNPYFYAKLSHKIQLNERMEVPSISLIKRLQPIAATLLLAVGISFGILIGKNLADNKIAKNDSDRKVMLDTYASEYYLNDTSEESLNVLLTNQE